MAFCKLLGLMSSIFNMSSIVIAEDACVKAADLAGQDDVQRRREAEAARRRRDAEDTDAEWGGSRPSGRDPGQGTTIPRTEKYDLEPYDDDDWEPSAAPRGPSEADKYGTQGSAALQRKLAQLELDVDREQGWIRGGSKTDVQPSSCS